MTVATWLQTNFTTQDATTYKGSIDADLAVAARVAGNFAPHAAATPGMSVVVDAGFVFAGAGPSPVLTTTAAQTLTIGAAPSAPNSRIDRVVIDRATGVASVVAGTPGNPGTAPAIPAARMPCAQVAVAAGVTAIANSMITDERAVWTIGRGALADLGIGRGLFEDGGGNLAALSGIDHVLSPAATSYAATAADAGALVDGAQAGGALTVTLPPIAGLAAGYTLGVRQNLHDVTLETHAGDGSAISWPGGTGTSLSIATSLDHAVVMFDGGTGWIVLNLSPQLAQSLSLPGSAPAKASAAEVASQTAANHYISPDLLASSHAVAKAWVAFGYNGSAVAISASFGVAGVTRLAMGQYEVTFSSAMSSANYVGVVMCGSAGASGPVYSDFGVQAPTSTTFAFNARDTSGSLADGTYIFAVFFG